MYLWHIQYDEITCVHAIAVLKDRNVTYMHPYWSDYNKPDALAKTYEVPMVPMSDKEDWSVLSNVICGHPDTKYFLEKQGKERKKC